MSTATAYAQGWSACFAGDDGRFGNPYNRDTQQAFAWDAGFLDAMEAEDGEDPQPAAAGFEP